MIRLGRRAAAVAAAAVATVAGSATWAATAASASTTTRSTAATAAHVIPRCTPGDLAVWVNANSDDHTAGTTFFHLDFTNIGPATCHLNGWPGVAAFSASSKQLGPAAERVALPRAAYVNIPAGGTAHAILGYVDIQVTPACKPVVANHLKVFAPGDTGARDAYFPAKVCTTSTKDLVIWRVQPGV